MKTLSKKLLSLLLVAVMLVAAMPFAAFADDGEETQAKTTYTVIVKLGADKTTATEVARGTYTSATVPDVVDPTGEKAAAFLQSVDNLSPAFSNAGLKFEAASVKNGNVYIRYSKPTHEHTWEVISSDGATATQHVAVCKDRDATQMQDHVWSEVTGAVAETHTTEGYTGDKHCTVCGYEVKGTVISKLPEHTFVNGVCACGAKQYSVTITVDGTAQNYTPVVEAGETADMSNAAGVLAKLGLSGKNYTTSNFNKSDYVITFTATSPAPTNPSAQTVNITLINGNSQSTQTVEVGKYYSDYAAFNPASQDGRTPESLKIESNNGTTRFVNVNTKTDSGKILATDTKVTIQWKAADRQIRFYTDSTLGKIYKTLTVYSGKAIGELPTEVNGKAVEYWTVWGSRIYTTTTYDWTADYVDAVPHFAGETGKVYLEVYVNGNRTSKYAQVDITHKLQDGVIYRDTLLDTIRNATKNNSLKLSSVSYLFNESEWSQYVRNVNNTTTNTKIQIGTDFQDARYVYVMVNGVTTKTTDPSNPKTGDSAKLGVAAAVLAVAVVGFGAVIVVNKKKGKI